MEIFFLIFLLVFLGSFSAFFSAIPIYYAHEVLAAKLGEDSESLRSLEEVRNKFEDPFSPFIFIEMFCYALAAVLAGAAAIKFYDNWLYTLYGLLFVFVPALLLRTLFYAIGMRVASRAAVSLLPIFQFFNSISLPFSYALKIIKVKIIGKSEEEASREELNAMLESSREDGALDAGEYRILKNMMKFSSVLVSDVMTPRTVIFSCNADKTVGEVAGIPELKMFSRFPIWEGDSLDNGVIGYVMSRDVLNAALEGKSGVKVREFFREAYFIPENAELDKALDRFLQRRQHLFIVVDEYGGVEGLLTMEDVLETILGVEIVDEADKVVDLREFAKNARDKRVASIIGHER